MSITSHIVRTLFTIGDLKRDLGWKKPRNVDSVENISYAEDDKWHLLDVYRPRKATGPLPVIVNIHGGAWVYGDKKVYAPYCMYLASRGFAVINASYRLAPRHIFPAPLEDVGKMVEWVFHHSDEYGLDLSNLFFVGDSAGAHLATAYTAIQLNEAYAKSFPEIKADARFIPKGLLLNCGVFDMEAEWKKQGRALTPFLTDLLGEKPTVEAVKQMSPAQYMTSDFPPVHLTTSNGDFLRKHSYRLKEVLEKKRVEDEFKEYGDKKKPQGQVFHLNLKNKVGQQCNEDQIQYIRNLIK